MQSKSFTRRSRRLAGALIFTQVAALAAVATPAQAQQLDPVAIPPSQQLGRPDTTSQRTRGAVYRQGLAEERNLTVMEVEREGYEPLGARLADNWLMFGSVEGSYEYNDNIYSTTNNTEKDSILTLAPTLRLRSDLPQHQLNVDVGGISRRFMDNDSEDTDSYFVRSNGRYDLSSTSFLFGNLGTSRQFEDRGSPNAAAGAEPTEYQRYDATAGFGSTALRLTYQGDVTLRRFDYNDVDAGGGGKIDNDGRDINIGIVSGRVGWEWQEGLVTYVRGAYNRREHFSTQPTFDRDSKGFDGGVGVTLSRPTVYTVDASVGFLTQDYEDPRFGDVTKPTLIVNGAYNITPLTSLVGNLNRTIEETTTANASSLVQTVASVGVEHELMYNLLGRITLTRIWSDYQDISREDDIWQAAAEVKYLFSRNFYLAPRVQYSDRSSPVGTSEYDQWRAIVVVGAQL